MIEKDGTVTVGVDTTKQEHLSTGQCYTVLIKSLHVVLLRDTAVQYHMVSCDRNQQNAFVLENTGSKESGNH